VSFKETVLEEKPEVNTKNFVEDEDELRIGADEQAEDQIVDFAINPQIICPQKFLLKREINLVLRKMML
jgi:hypothetical protein